MSFVIFIGAVFDRAGGEASRDTMLSTVRLYHAFECAAIFGPLLKRYTADKYVIFQFDLFPSALKQLNPALFRLIPQFDRRVISQALIQHVGDG